MYDDGGNESAKSWRLLCPGVCVERLQDEKPESPVCEHSPESFERELGCGRSSELLDA